VQSAGRPEHARADQSLSYPRRKLNMQQGGRLHETTKRPVEEEVRSNLDKRTSGGVLHHRKEGGPRAVPLCEKMWVDGEGGRKGEEITGIEIPHLSRVGQETPLARGKTPSSPSTQKKSCCVHGVRIGEKKEAQPGDSSR